MRFREFRLWLVYRAPFSLRFITSFRASMPNGRHAVVTVPCPFLFSLGFFDLRDRELAVDAVGHESHLVARLDRFEHGGIGSTKDHRHPLAHAKLLERPVLDDDLPG